MAENKNYENKILDAIETIVGSAVSKAEFDKTIQGTVSRVVDGTIGKYLIKYQDSSFFAYSTNTDISYSVGNGVYILIPGNDWSRDKTILGAVDKLGSDYINNIEQEDQYEVVGSNTINSLNTYQLCSYKEETLVLYNKDENINLINLDADAARIYMEKSSSMLFGASFKTSIPNEQKFKGNYGIEMKILYSDNLTGDDLIRVYTIDIDNMEGSPYSFNSFTKQVLPYKIEGLNFKEVLYISLFCNNFPYTSNTKPNDIFVKDIQLFGAELATEEELSSCYLSFITKKGIYYSTTDLESTEKTIEAQVKVKGKVVDKNSQSIEYYWFKEDCSIDKTSQYYNKLGGNGWKCLNQSNIISSLDESYIEWVSGDYEIKILKNENIARENKYKCIAIYNDTTIISKDIVIYNYDSNYKITIESDLGKQFYFDLGSPTLTCYVNGIENNTDYTYQWGRVDYSGIFNKENITQNENNEYNTALSNYNNLITSIKNEEVLKENVATQLEEYLVIINKYDTIKRVENNKIINIQVKDIVNFSVYSCSVYKNNQLVGTSSITLYNSLEKANNYNIILNNGINTYKYNENGISPASKSLENPIQIMPLSFILFDDEGIEVPMEAIPGSAIKWSIPNTNTLITSLPSNGDPISTSNGMNTYSNISNFGYSIAAQYNQSYSENNKIKLEITYKDITYKTETNLIFIKEGQSGTNGTDFVCRIVPNSVEDNFLDYPTIAYNKALQNYTINYTPKQSGYLFKAELWKDGENILSSVNSSTTTEGKNAIVKWSVLKNKYSNTIYDDSNFAINENTGLVTIDPTNYDSPSNIIKCEIIYQGMSYFAVMPLIFTTVKNSEYSVLLKNNSGFRSVQYSADSINPLYNSSNPFELLVTQTIDGIKSDISQLETSEYHVFYNWAVKGKVYNSEWQSELNLIEKSMLRSQKNQKKYIPVDFYNGLALNNALYCSIVREGNELASIHIPIHFYLNRYGNSAINGWDGNSISINEDEGFILAPQVGAGKKENDNSFTGIFMGSVKEDADSNLENGLFGYNAGERTIHLNAETGASAFGKKGSGQIIIDPTTGEAILKSGDYDKAAGTGMAINLSEPSIEFANGNFKVDKNGTLSAKVLETIGEDINNLEGTVIDLDASIDKFTVLSSSNSIIIPCNENHYPIDTQSYAINLFSKYKGQTVIPAAAFDKVIPGISRSYSNNVVTFTVNKNNPIQNLSNEITVTYTYTIDGKTYTTTQLYTITLAVQGTQGVDGAPGKDGETGATTYFHIKYAPVINPSASQMTETPDKYIGTYVDFTEADSVNPSDYTWSQFQGDDGIAGTNGSNGETSYIHIRYSNDAGATFTANNGKTPGDYLGQYTDFTLEDSSNVNSYTWTLIKGEEGKSSYTFIRYSANQNGAGMTTTPQLDTKYMGIANVSVNQAPTSASSYTWTLIKGEDGDSPYFGYLTNENHTFVAGTSKTVTTQLVGYYGIEEKEVTLLTVNGISVSTTQKETGITGLKFSVSSTSSTLKPVISFIASSELAQSLSETLEITFKIGTNLLIYKTVFSISTTTPGTNGINANLVNISASSKTFLKGVNDTNYLPSAITLVPFVQGDVSYSSWEYSTNAGSTWTAITAQTQGATITGTGSLVVSNNSFITNSTVDNVVVKCKTTNEEVYDTIDIIKIRESKDGESTYNVILTNESQNIPGSTTAAYATTISTNIIGYYGVETVNTTVGTISGLPSGMTSEIKNNNSKNTEIVFTVAEGMTSPGGQIIIPITVGSLTINRIFSYSVSYTGAAGAAQREYYIAPSTNTVIKNGEILTPSTVTFDAFYKDGNSVEKNPYIGSWLIQSTSDGEEWTNIVSPGEGSEPSIEIGQSFRSYGGAVTEGAFTPGAIDSWIYDYEATSVSGLAIDISVSGTYNINIFGSYQSYSGGPKPCFVYVLKNGAIVKSFDLSFTNDIIYRETTISFELKTGSYTVVIGASQSYEFGFYTGQITYENIPETGADGDASSKIITVNSNMKQIRAFLGAANTLVTESTALDIQTVPILTDLSSVSIGTRNIAFGTKDFSEEQGYWDIGGNVLKNLDNTFAELVIQKDGFANSNSFFKKENSTMFENGITVSFEVKRVEAEGGILNGKVCVLKGTSGVNTYIYDEPDLLTGKLYNKSFFELDYGEWVKVYCFFSKDSFLMGTDKIYPDTAKISFTMPDNGYLRIRKVKIEYGNISTDWTEAPEDIQKNIDEKAVSSIENEYCYGESLTVTPLETDPSWSPSTPSRNEEDEKKYLWARIKYVYMDTSIKYESYSCLATATKTLKEEYMEYILSTSSDSSPEENAAWQNKKPSSSDPNKPYLWTRRRLVYEYANSLFNTKNEYCDYSLDTSWNQLFSLTDELADAVSTLQGNINGIVRIQGDTILIGDKQEDPNNVIVMNSGGIGFYQNSTGKWPTQTDIANVTSVWKIDGTFDAETINVINLTATNILNQDLRLGKQGTAGSFELRDVAGHLIAEINPSGMMVYKYVNDIYKGYISISNTGMQEYNESDELLFGNDGENNFFGDTIKTEQLVLQNEENAFGIQIVPMEITENNIVHRGIGFIPKQ